jgi:hypothetical protein
MRIERSIIFIPAEIIRCILASHFGPSNALMFGPEKHSLRFRYYLLHAYAQIKSTRLLVPTAANWSFRFAFLNGGN